MTTAPPVTPTPVNFKQHGNYEFIIYEKDPVAHIARITFNRPEKLNAFHPPMEHDVIDAINDLEADLQIKVLILRGAGRAFSTGGDLSQVGRMYGWEDPKPGETKPRRPSQRVRLFMDRRAGQFFAKVFYCNKATIAQVQGYAVGGGFNLTCCTDFIICSEDAKFGHPGVRIVGPGFHMNTMLWIYKMGVTLAKELDFTGRYMDAKEAWDRKFVNKVAPNDKLEEETMKWAQAIAQIPADGIALGKAAYQLLADIQGMNTAFSAGYLCHSLGSNMRYEEDELNFFKERRDKGTRSAIHKKDERFKGRIESDARFKEGEPE